MKTSISIINASVEFVSRGRVTTVVHFDLAIEIKGISVPLMRYCRASLQADGTIVDASGPRKKKTTDSGKDYYVNATYMSKEEEFGLFFLIKDLLKEVNLGQLPEYERPSYEGNVTPFNVERNNKAEDAAEKLRKMASK